VGALGLKATITVEHPRQVGAENNHSLAEIAVDAPSSLGYTFLEAGWIVQGDHPASLFANHWLRGNSSCNFVAYHQRCGFVPSGGGLLPGAMLVPGTKLTVEWRQLRRKWWLFVDDKPSGYYPDSLWHGRSPAPRRVDLWRG